MGEWKKMGMGERACCRLWHFHTSMPFQCLSGVSVLSRRFFEVLQEACVRFRTESAFSPRNPPDSFFLQINLFLSPFLSLLIELFHSILVPSPLPHSFRRPQPRSPGTRWGRSLARHPTTLRSLTGLATSSLTAPLTSSAVSPRTATGATTKSTRRARPRAIPRPGFTAAAARAGRPCPRARCPTTRQRTTAPAPRLPTPA